MPTNVSPYAPGRPPNSRDSLNTINGSPVFLGVIESTGIAVNNATTTTPFNYIVDGGNMKTTLAGKMLMLQPDAAGYMLPSSSTALDITSQALPSTNPGLLLGINERVQLMMLPQNGWLQWLPYTTGNLFVWVLM